jgi:hypothetical protein
VALVLRGTIKDKTKQMYKLRLNTYWSNVFVGVYILGTMYLRFLIEPQFNGNILVSVGLGLFALLFLWALAKSRFINPSFWKS